MFSVLWSRKKAIFLGFFLNLFLFEIFLEYFRSKAVLNLLSDFNFLILFHSIDVYLLLLIILGFFYFLRVPNLSEAVLEYIFFLVFIFLFYLIVAFRLSNFLVEIVVMNQVIFFFDNSIFFIRFCLIFFAVFVLLLTYWEFVVKNFFILEFPFLIAFLFWFFCVGIASFNLLFLFLVMEAITLLLVIVMSIYFIFFGAKLIMPVIQFFIFNLVVSTFYLLGIALLLFFTPISGFENLSYFAFLINFWTFFLGGFVELNLLLVFFKLILVFFVIPFFFKLSLAPFSFWVVQIYSKLPILFLVILMGVYKLVYVILFLKLFMFIIDNLTFLQGTLSSLLTFFVVPSMFVGCLAYRSSDLKAVIAFTTVSQLGYIISGFLVHDPVALKYSLVYLVTYVLNLCGLFLVFIVLQKHFFLVNINQLFLVKYYSQKWFYFIFILFCSLAGFPPFLGFFIKYFLFLHIYKAGFFGIALAALVSSYVMAIIYLQIIIELSLVKNFETTTTQFRFNFTSLLLQKNKYWILNIIFVLFNFYLYSLMVFNIGFFGFLFYIFLVSGAVVSNFIYGVPTKVNLILVSEAQSWLGERFFISSCRGLQETASESIKRLWDQVTLYSMAVDLSVLTEHIDQPSIEFVLKDREEVYKIGPETAAAYLFYPGKAKISGGTEIPFELYWYVYKNPAILNYSIYVIQKFALSCVSIEDYLSIQDIFILRYQITVEDLWDNRFAITIPWEVNSYFDLSSLVFVLENFNNNYAFHHSFWKDGLTCSEPMRFVSRTYKFFWPYNAGEEEFYYGFSNAKFPPENVVFYNKPLSYDSLYEHYRSAFDKS